MAYPLRMPRKINGKWDPMNPAEWKAYVSRQRWFRTPNDAFMTGNFHVSASLMQSVLKTQTLSWVQVLLASTYSGAFHPTAEGHAAIADGLIGEVRFAPEHLTGVFEPLKDPDYFRKVYIDHGVVEWPGQIDLAPDAMYNEIKANGVWVLA